MNAPSRTSGKPERTWPAVAALLVLALAVRGGVLLALPGGLSLDPDGYRRIAENVLRSGVYSFDQPDEDFTIDENIRPTAYRPPLYPLLLTKFESEQHVTPLHVGVLHLLLGVATVWLTWYLGRLWKLGHWSLVAALFVACDPILLNQSTQVMTETLATFLAVLSLYSLTRFCQAATPWNAMLAGGSIGLAILCRPTFLPWLLLVAVVTPFVSSVISRRQSEGQGKKTTARSIILRIANLVALVLAAAAMLAPWTIRNYREFGKPIVTTTHGGYTFALGNNQFIFDHLRDAEWGAVWHSSKFDGTLRRRLLDGFDLTEIDSDYDIQRDTLAYEMAIEDIQHYPLMFLYACVYRIGQLWSPLPHDVEGDSPSQLRQLARYPIAAWYVGLFVLAIGGAVSLRWQLFRPPWVWGVLLSLAFTAIHTLYWSNLRMRAPLMPFVCLLAAIGAAHVVYYLRKRRAARS